jgi:ectoine hydroxylase-related dioxygenase (phytanoyl-CoA dioxygenase family)
MSDPRLDYAKQYSDFQFERDNMSLANVVKLREELREQGAIHVPNALDENSMRLARDAYQWSLCHPSRNSAQFQGTAGAPSKFYQDLLNPNALTGYRRLLDESCAADVVAELWDSPDVWFMYEQVFLKEGGESRRTPWHQDSSYLPIAGEKIAVMWISFEPVSKEDSLEFVRRSHRGTLYDGSRFDPNDDTAPIYGTLPRLPNIEADLSKWDIVSWAVEPGDVLIFHPAMLHGGAPTHGGRRRSTLSLRFFGDDAIYSPLPGAERVGDSDNPDRPGSPFQDMQRKCKAGDPFRHPGFPKVRPRA